MRKNRRRIATVATVAALGGLGAVALESNPGPQALGSQTAMVAGHGSRPIVTGASGSTSAIASGNATSAQPSPHKPLISRTSGGAGVDHEDD
jgi:hypothetical protein